MRIIIFLFSLCLFSCGSEQTGNTLTDTPSKVIMKTETSLDKTRNYTDSSYYTKVPILLDRLKKNGYKFPDAESFRNIILKIFSVDVDTLRTDSYTPNMCDSRYLNFTIFRKDGFILYEKIDETSVEALQTLKPTRDKDMFFQLNAYLFNNSIEGRMQLQQNKPVSLQKLLFNYGYPLQDSIITNAYLKEKQRDAYSESDWVRLICNVDCNPTISSIKENMAKWLARMYPDQFEIASAIVLFPDIRDEKRDGPYGIGFLNNEVKYKCWGYLLDASWYAKNQSNFVEFFSDNEKLHLERYFKEHKYYNLKGLEIFCLQYESGGIMGLNHWTPPENFWELSYLDSLRKKQ